MFTLRLWSSCPKQAEEKEQEIQGMSFTAELFLFKELKDLLTSHWLSLTAKETKKCWHLAGYFATPNKTIFLSLKKGKRGGS